MPDSRTCDLSLKKSCVAEYATMWAIGAKIGEIFVICEMRHNIIIEANNDINLK